MILHLWGGKRLRSRRKHYFVMAIMWIWAVVWAVCVIYIGTRWNDPSTPLVIGVSAVLIVATPDPETLFYPYDKYVEEWERDNEPEGGG